MKESYTGGCYENALQPIHPMPPCVSASAGFGKFYFLRTNMDTKRCLLLFHLVFDSGDPFFHLVLFCFNLSALSCYVLIQ